VSELSLPAVPDVLAEHAEVLAGVVVPCVGYRWRAADRGAPDHDPGGSRLYGDPDLPEGFVWPVADDGRPLPFALQVDLDAVARRFPGRVPLPDSPGLLQFFTTFVSDEHVEEWDTGLYKPERGQNRIVVHRDPAGLRRTRGPVVADYDGMDATVAQPLLPEAGVSAPDVAELWRPQHEALREVVRADKETLDAYRDWQWEMSSPNQLGGYASWLQDVGFADAVTRERALTHRDLYGGPGGQTNRPLVEEIFAASDSWRLVFQVDSLIGDDGRLYFVAPLDADGAYDLNRVQVVYQCT
jgi:hypothetical protein